MSSYADVTHWGINAETTCSDREFDQTVSDACSAFGTQQRSLSKQEQQSTIEKQRTVSFKKIMWGVRWLCCRAPPGHDQIEESHLFNYFWIAEMSIFNIFASAPQTTFG